MAITTPDTISEVDDDPDPDQLGRTCRSCAAGTYGLGPGAGHVTCDECGHATVRRMLVGPRARRS